MMCTLLIFDFSAHIIIHCALVGWLAFCALTVSSVFVFSSIFFSCSVFMSGFLNNFHILFVDEFQMRASFSVNLCRNSACECIKAMRIFGRLAKVIWICSAFTVKCVIKNRKTTSFPTPDGFIRFWLWEWEKKDDCETCVWIFPFDFRKYVWRMCSVAYIVSVSECEQWWNRNDIS